MKRFCLALFVLLISLPALAQPAKKPKLVVGIVVDQMRSDYIEKYWDGFGDNGFKRLVNNGFWCQNTQYNYMPTHTGPGHTSIYTGSVPAIHGIVSNDWYQRSEGRVVYCASDADMKPVGAPALLGTYSPHRLKATTLGDQVELATMGRGKTIGISIKDRGAILPAGRTADAAYWFDGSSGNWVTSTWYTDSLPSWVRNYNAQRRPDICLQAGWKAKDKPETYLHSLPDENTYEVPFNGSRTATLPYKLRPLAQLNGGYNILKCSPWGSTLTCELAIEAIQAEKLGQDNDVDLLAVSFSSPDVIGHRFGSNSRELEDAYRWLDADLAKLFAMLDKQVGKGNYLVFLTADHGAAPVPQRMIDNQGSAGYYSNRAMTAPLEAHLDARFGKADWIESFSNDQVYFSEAALAKRKIDLEEISAVTIAWLQKQEGVAQAFTKREAVTGCMSNPIYERVKNGINQHRSGDVIVLMEPGWMVGSPQGTSHGSPYAYDMHVPLLWMGTGISAGKTSVPVFITDIAPTVALLSGLQYPSGCVGNPIVPVLESSK